MRTEDLQIGDWVTGRKWREKPFQITRINEANKFFYGNTGDTHVGPFLIEELEPIPLTPEILEKNGFEKLDFSHFQIGDRRLVLDADGRWDGPLSWHWVVTEMSTNAKGQPVVLDYYVATINYVHKLQHALRICGIEKEIQI